MTEQIQTAIMITGFVMAMMLMIECVNVLSSGAWQRKLASERWGQYALGAILGAIPGCLGAFGAVAMYSHGVLTRGALVTTMVAATGDEAFVLLALIPVSALKLMAMLAPIGIATGVAVDWIGGNRRTQYPAECLELHVEDQRPHWRSSEVAAQWRRCVPERALIALVLVLFFMGILTGQLGPRDQMWIRVALAVATGLALLAVSVVPDHFLREHLWRHVVRKHGARIFLWTLVALIATELLMERFHLEGAVGCGEWWLLLIACLAGVIPESGPHLIFVTLFAEGAAPFSVLLASSIVQDGHGMLPMLAHSAREFIAVKGISFSAGLLVGAVAMASGW